MSFVVGNVVLVGDEAALISKVNAGGYEAIYLDSSNCTVYLTADNSARFYDKLREDLTSDEELEIEMLTDKYFDGKNVYNDPLPFDMLPDKFKYSASNSRHLDNVKYLANSVKAYISAALLINFKGLNFKNW